MSKGLNKDMNIIGLPIIIMFISRLKYDFVFFLKKKIVIFGSSLLFFKFLY